MTNVVSLSEFREAQSPHYSGPAHCINCKHEWVAVAPSGTLGLDCPSCGSTRGLPKHLLQPHNKTTLHCPTCDLNLWSIQPSGKCCCASCGYEQTPMIFPQFEG